MANKPSRGKLLELYNAISQDSKVSKDDIVGIAIKINEENPDHFNQQDINNLLNQNRGFMIPYQGNYFVRSDSSLLSESKKNPVNHIDTPDLDGKKLYESLENVKAKYEEIKNQNQRDIQDKSRIEQRLNQNQEQERKLKDILESAKELARRAAV